jgi:hypothetical protein
MVIIDVYPGDFPLPSTTGRALAKFEAGRDVWQEVLNGVREIKAGGGRRSVVEPRHQS